MRIFEMVLDNAIKAKLLEINLSSDLKNLVHNAIYYGVLKKMGPDSLQLFEDKNIATHRRVFHDPVHALRTAELRTMGVGARRQGYQMFTGLRDGYLDSIRDTLRWMALGRVSRTSATDSLRQLVYRSFRDAFVHGRGARHHDLTSEDENWLRTASRHEMHFLLEFIDRVSSRSLVIFRRSRTRITANLLRLRSMQALLGYIDWRVRFYPSALESLYQSGEVHSSPPNTVIDWQMRHTAEHCASCVFLSLRSPFTASKLPCTPGSGSTHCRMNCKCLLVHRQVSAEEFHRIDQGLPSRVTLLRYLRAA